jgi:hypothetical protein
MRDGWGRSPRRPTYSLRVALRPRVQKTYEAVLAGDIMTRNERCTSSIDLPSCAQPGRRPDEVSRVVTAPSVDTRWPAQHGALSGMSPR